MRTDPVRCAHRIIEDRFPEARAAWLGGSVVRGEATSTSDLDITVLLAGPPAPYRHSTVVSDWPVELFVHTETSLDHYRETDQARRQPTLMRLVGESVLLVDRDGSGARLRRELADEVAAGPRPLTEEELASARYAVTDLLTDLEGLGGPESTESPQTIRRPHERDAVASRLWEQAAALLLTGSRRWTGTGKGLVRELTAYDEACGSTYVAGLLDGLRDTLGGDIAPLVEVCDAILAAHGGRLFDGHRLGGTDPGPDG